MTKTITAVHIEKLPCCSGKSVSVEIDGACDELSTGWEHDESCRAVLWIRKNLKPRTYARTYDFFLGKKKRSPRL